MRLKLLGTSGALVAFLLLPAAAASADTVEIGKIEATVKASCPATCNAFARATGYQAKVGTKRGLMTVPQDGRIVAFTVGLGKPGPKQVAFFTDGDPAKGSPAYGVPEVQLSILDPKRKLRARVVAQSSPFPVARYFGQTVQIALGRSLHVKKGQIVAITTKTWAPILGLGFGSDTSWRASRERGTCTDNAQEVAQTELTQLAQYYCLYRTVRLAYSATLVTDPVPNPETSSKTPATTKKPTTKTGATGNRRNRDDQEVAAHQSRRDGRRLAATGSAGAGVLLAERRARRSAAGRRRRLAAGRRRGRGGSGSRRGAGTTGGGCRRRLRRTRGAGRAAAAGRGRGGVGGRGLLRGRR